MPEGLRLARTRTVTAWKEPPAELGLEGEASRGWVCLARLPRVLVESRHRLLSRDAIIAQQVLTTSAATQPTIHLAPPYSQTRNQARTLHPRPAPTPPQPATTLTHLTPHASPTPSSSPGPGPDDAREGARHGLLPESARRRRPCPSLGARLAVLGDHDSAGCHHWLGLES